MNAIIGVGHKEPVVLHVNQSSGEVLADNVKFRPWGKTKVRNRLKEIGIRLPLDEQTGI